jgi:hypothetical protein
MIWKLIFRLPLSITYFVIACKILKDPSIDIQGSNKEPIPAELSSIPVVFYYILCFTLSLETLIFYLQNAYRDPQLFVNPYLKHFQSVISNNMLEQCFTLFQWSILIYFFHSLDLLVLIGIKAAFYSVGLFASIWSKSHQYKLVFQTFFGLLEMSHFLLCVSTPRNQYPILLYFLKVPEFGIISFVFLIFFLHFITIIVTGSSTAALYRNRLPSLDSEYSMALFQLFHMVLDVSRSVGFTNEYPPVRYPKQSKNTLVRYNLRSKSVLSKKAQSSTKRISTVFEYLKPEIMFGSPKEEDKISDSESDSSFKAENVSSDEDEFMNEVKEKRLRQELYEELFFLGQDQTHINEEEIFSNQQQKQILNPNACVVCMSDSREVLLLPCRCLCICDECRENLASRGYNSCPTCRKDVQGWCRVFEP